MRDRLLAGVAALAVLAMAPSAFAQQKSGVAAAVNPQAQASAGAAAPRTLMVGQDVIFGERIRTGAQGQVQLLFLDESSLTVGPNSDITIDEFVYDPNAKQGRMSMSMSSGLARFVGGRISKSGNVAVTTPTATIGIRGGTGIIEVENPAARQIASADPNFVAQAAPPPTTRAINLFGTMSVRGTGGGEQIVSRPGFQVVSIQNQSISAPTRLSPQQLAQINNRMEGPPPAAGGAAAGPGAGQQGAGTPRPSAQTIEASFARSDVGSRNSDQPAGNVSSNLAGGNAVQRQTARSGNTDNVQNVTQRATTQQGQDRITQTVIVTSPNNPVNTTTNKLSVTGSLLDINNVTQGSFTGTIDRLTNLAELVDNTGARLNIVLPAPDIKTRFENIPTILGTGSVIQSRTTDGEAFFARFQVGSAALAIVGGVPTPASLLAAPNGGEYRVFSRNSLALFSDVTFPYTNSSRVYSNFAESPMVWRVRSGGEIGDTSNGRTVTLHAAIGISGTGANQTSEVVVSTGGLFNSEQYNNRPVMSAVVRGTRDVTGTNQSPDRISANLGSEVDGQGRAFFGSTGPNTFLLTEQGFESNGRRVSTNDSGVVNSFYGRGQEFRITDGYSRDTRPIPSEFANGSRTTRTMNGYASGYGALTQGTSTSLVVTTGLAQPGTFDTSISQFVGDPTRMAVTTNATTNRVSGSMTLDSQNISTGLAGSNPFVRFQLLYGSQTPDAFRARSAFVNDQVWAALDQRLTADAVAGSRVAFGNSTTPNPVNFQSTDGGIDPTTNLPNAGDQLYMFTHAAAPVAQGLMPSGVAICACDFMSWGWWGGEVRFQVAGVSANQRLRIHLGQFVVGVLPLASVIPTTGTATYNGHAIGTVASGTTAISQYLAGGGYSKSWNFATRTGTVSLNQFDGVSYTTAVSASASNPRDWGGSQSQSGAASGRVLFTRGSFFSSPTDPVKGSGGEFSISGTGYSARGVVIGQR
jgi:hypothetical protein